MEDDEVFDFLRGDFFTATVDLVLDPADHAQIAAGHELDEVAGVVVPLVIERLGILFGALVVPAKSVRATCGEHARFSVRDGEALFVNDFDFIVGADRTALGSKNLFVGVI